MMRSRFIVALAVASILAACGTSNRQSPEGFNVRDVAPPSGAGAYKIGKPYQIKGVWYYPGEDFSYDETGIASWYGADYHAKYTANGDPFDPNAVTAAHRTLPMPSIVRVSNLDNGRAIVVRINDRGPFAHGRIIDLSKRAAEMLGIDQTGTARVRVQILADESRALALKLKSGDETPIEAAPKAEVVAEALPPPPGRTAAPPKKGTHKPVQIAKAPDAAPVAEEATPDQTIWQSAPKATQIYVQAGAFGRFDNANRVSVALSGIGATAISQIHTKSGTIFRVRLGPLASVADADAMLEKVIASGYPDARVVVD